MPRVYTRFVQAPLFQQQFLGDLLDWLLPPPHAVPLLHLLESGGTLWGVVRRDEGRVAGNGGNLLQ